MHKSWRVVVLALTGSLLCGVAWAADEDGFDISQVTAAYSDGYIGTDHQFHPWIHRSDAEELRAKHLDLYHAWRHDDPRHAHDNAQ